MPRLHRMIRFEEATWRLPSGFTCAALLLAGVLVACASSSDPADTRPPPESRSVIPMAGRGILVFNEPGVGARTVGLPLVEIWAAMTTVYEELEIPVEYYNESLFEIGNPGYRARRVEGERMSKYLDCGNSLTGPRADQYDVLLSIVTRLTPVSSDSTVIETTLDANARPRATSGSSVHCISKGELEMRVALLTQYVVLRERGPESE